MLAKLVKRDFVEVRAEAVDWEDATRRAGRLMADNGCVHESYIERMLNTTRELGPYNVIAPGIALAHARPGEGVIRTAVSFVTLRDPVVFGNPEHDPVQLVIGMAAPDNDTHLGVITHIARFLSDCARFDCICDCGSAREVVRLIRAMEWKRRDALIIPAG